MAQIANVDISQGTSSWRGVFDSAVNYAAGSIVEDAGGNYWRAFTNVVAGATAPDDPAWQLVTFRALRLAVDPA